MGMNYPRAYDNSVQREVVTDFRGYDHNLRIPNEEFFDTQNVSADYYPLLSTRVNRKRIRWISNLAQDPDQPELSCNGFLSHDELCWINNDRMVWKGTARGGTLPSTGAKRTMVGMGARVVIWPDKYIFDPTQSPMTLTPLEATYNTSTTAEVRLVTWDYRSSTIHAGTTPPGSYSDGTLWNDTSVSPVVLRRYSAVAGDWVSVPTFYIRIKINNIANSFRRYDGVTISGFNNTALNGSYTLYGASQIENWILISGSVTSLDGTAAAGGITIKREVPDLDFVCEWENRLWGCKSGTNEIYASALGDPTNWNQFAGVSTDSYVVNVGSPGNFTGCCVYNGQPLFFKEDRIYRIYGNRPSNFQLNSIECRGVEAGSERSLCNVYGTLFYKSPFDICALSGGYPQSISHALGHVKYKNAICGANGKKLYITMQDGNNAYHTFTFDTENGIWCREDSFPVQYYAAYGDDLFAVSEDPTNPVSQADRDYLWSINGSDSYNSHFDVPSANLKTEPDFDWYAETGDIELATPDHEYVTKIQLRFELEAGSSLRVLTKYDSDDEWEEKHITTALFKHSEYVPVIPKRCDHMRIRIEGHGHFKLYSMARTIEQGSEV